MGCAFFVFIIDILLCCLKRTIFGIVKYIKKLQNKQGAVMHNIYRNTQFNKTIYENKDGGINWAKLELDIRRYTRLKDQITLLNDCLRSFGVTKEKIRDALGVSEVSTIDKYENGKTERPNGNFLLRYIKLGVKRTIVNYMLDSYGETERLIKDNSENFYKIMG